MAPERHAMWHAIVRDGIYSSKGMVGFGESLDIGQSDAIRAYVIEKANGLAGAR